MQKWTLKLPVVCCMNCKVHWLLDRCLHRLFYVILFLFYTIRFYSILFYFILFYSILFYFIFIFNLTLFYFILFEVAIGLIKGKATHIIWPLSRWQRLENVTSEGRLAFEENNPLSESENGTDTLSDTVAETQNGKSGTCRSYVDRDSNSVPDFMYGPTSWPGTSVNFTMEFHVQKLNFSCCCTFFIHWCVAFLSNPLRRFFFSLWIQESVNSLGTKRRGFS